MPIKQSDRTWIIYSFSAMICFLIGNFTVGQISEYSGKIIFMYFAGGQIITSLVYYCWEIYK